MHVSRTRAQNRRWAGTGSRPWCAAVTMSRHYAQQQSGLDRKEPKFKRDGARISLLRSSPLGAAGQALAVGYLLLLPALAGGCVPAGAQASLCPALRPCASCDLCFFRQPSFMGGLGIPFIFGPVGGGEATPRPLRRGFPVGNRLAEKIRELGNSLIPCDPLMRYTFSRAEIIACTTSETVAGFQPATGRSAWCNWPSGSTRQK